MSFGTLNEYFTGEEHNQRTILFWDGMNQKELMT